MYFFLIFLFCHLAYGGGGGFVGNGGDGIILPEGKIQLRDFYENDINELYFGPIQERIRASVYSSQNLLKAPINHEMLASKLSDLNRHNPGLGDALLLALRKFHFKFEYVDLPLLDPHRGKQRFARSPKRIFSDQERIQLAIRRYENIVFSKLNIDKMSDGQVIGLLIHEGFFSLMSPECSNQICEQDSSIVRSLTAESFRTPNDFEKSKWDDLIKNLQVPSNESMCEEPSSMAEISFYGATGKSESSRHETLFHDLERMNVNGAVIDSFCESIDSQELLSNFLVLDAIKKTINGRFSIHTTEFGPQTSVSIAIRPVRMKKVWYSINASSCKNELRKKISAFMENDSNNEMRVSCR